MKRLVMSLAAVLFASVPLVAHHSFAAVYFPNQSVSIEGELVAFEFRAPHTWVHVMVATDDGRILRYSAEWGGVRQLRRAGITQDTLHPGDYVRITGNPSREVGQPLLRLTRIERPDDGWQWDLFRRQRR